MGPFDTTTQEDAGMTPSGMVGMMPEDPTASPESQGNALGSVVEQVRGMEQGLLSLSQQFPAAAPEVRRAIEGVRAVLKRIVSSPTEAEPPAPRSLA